MGRLESRSRLVGIAESCGNLAKAQGERILDCQGNQNIMDELNDERKKGAWRTEHDRLEVEITQRLRKLKDEGILSTPRQLEDWLSGLKDRLFLKLGFDQRNKQKQGHWVK